MISRRNFLEGLLAAPIASRVHSVSQTEFARTNEGAKSIDRYALVKRHNPRLTSLNLESPLTLGNGEFAFTADVTGLQTLASEYERTVPLCTMSQWGWHTRPAPANLKNSKLRATQYDTYGRQVGYYTSADGQDELFNWLRENPHRLHLGRISLCYQMPDAEGIKSYDVSNIDQELDLWRGVLTSRFSLKGKPVTVTTAVHPEIDLLAVRVESNSVGTSALGVRFDFAYGSSNMQAADWTRPDSHQTKSVRKGLRHVGLDRQLDLDSYKVDIAWRGDATFKELSKHTFVLSPTNSTRLLEFVITFASHSVKNPLPTINATIAATESHWRRFWSNGGAVEFADSSDHRAEELERRVVLSQYLTAIQCSGSLPPQETGLTVNSWYGKFHLEMHWWHATHFALWNRFPLFEKSLAWYESILPVAKALALSQGYAGARWPKMVGPEGHDSPSPIGPLLIWQQPHPIFYAELCYQSHPKAETLHRYRDIVLESAAFMASYAHFDQNLNRYVLGPPVIPAQENHPPRETWNPTFELSYWMFGLKLAQVWRQRLGAGRAKSWDDVIVKLSRLPTRDGVYLAHENCPQTYAEKNRDHPSMLGALGFLPGHGVDWETMRRTLHKVMSDWSWSETWGWDYPLTALTAARLGEPKLAVNALLMETEKNRYLPNGHNWQRANLPCYLPGNGGLLYAVAMMAGGWRDARRGAAPGFPADGSWRVRAEKLSSALLVPSL